MALAQADLIEVIRLQSDVPENQGVTPRYLQGRIHRQSEFVSIITGVRRAGKSTLLRELMKAYPQVRYLNFEDFRLAGFEQGDFRNLEPAFDRVIPECTVYFFDEIQNAPGWESYVRTLNDAGNTVFITGSNAALLSRELGTKLTGRHLEYELFPMDFFEYCALKQREETVESLDSWLVDGGFPQYLKTGIAEYLQQIVKDILYRDIVRRHNIRNTALLEDLTRYLISNVAKEYSLRNISRILNNDSIHTLSEFVRYLEEAYLFFSVPIFSWSIRKQSVNPRKIYSIDNGLTSANTLSFSADKGRLLENAVYLSLRQRYDKVFYFKGRDECDFVVAQQHRVAALLQVCYSLTGENMARELRGLEEAMCACGCSNGVIITRDENGEYETEAGLVRSIAAIEWFRGLR